MTVYDPAAFAPLTEARWDEGSVRAAIERIAADAQATFGATTLWPADEWDGWQTPTPLKSLYVGAAGVIWALDALRGRGHAEIRLDLGEASRLTLDASRREPDFMRGVELPEPARAGLLTGQSGILAVAYVLTRDDAVADKLYERVRENVASTATGIMWGSPGTMVASRAMLDLTGDARWADAWRDSAARLLEARDEEGLWTQRLYGDSFRGLSPPYGLVGNVTALLRGRDLLSDPAALAEQTAALLRRAAIRDGDDVSWPSSLEPAARSDTPRLQWCSGAPGIVCCAASYLDEDVLLAAAETIWRAGGHGDEKGAGICHGTAGNGYALLAVLERTRDELWLERARRFAVHAVEQTARLYRSRGRGRYSLFTGDLGVALFASDCLVARARYPIFDGWRLP